MNGDNQTPSEPAKPPEQQPAPAPPTPEPQSHFYGADELDAPPQLPPAPEVTWTASEFVAHEKSFGWYAIATLVMLGLAALVYVLMRDFISIGVLLIVGILFMIMAGRPPRVLTYSLNNQGITIGTKFYPYTVLKSYGVVDEGAFSSIVLMPLRRFMPPLSVYCAPADQEKILVVLNQHLPFSQNVHDALDNLVRRIKF